MTPHHRPSTTASDEARRLERARALLLRAQARPLSEAPDEDAELLAREAEELPPALPERRQQPWAAVAPAAAKGPVYDRRKLGLPALEPAPAIRPDPAD